MNSRFKRFAGIALAGSMVISSSVPAMAADFNKHETVYVVTDESGNVTNTIVSDWLENLMGGKSLQDSSLLKNIEVVKGDAVRSGNMLGSKSADTSERWSPDSVEEPVSPSSIPSSNPAMTGMLKTRPKATIKEQSKCFFILFFIIQFSILQSAYGFAIRSRLQPE